MLHANMQFWYFSNFEVNQFSIDKEMNLGGILYKLLSNKTRIFAYLNSLDFFRNKTKYLFTWLSFEVFGVKIFLLLQFEYQ